MAADNVEASGVTAEPRVTIGMTLYNVERYLPLALDSLLAQNYSDFEIVLCDNASTDSTWDIVERYVARDPRIRAYRHERNVGMPENFRRLVGLARGELFKLHSHDDLAEPALVRACVTALDALGPRAVLAYPLTRIIDGEGRTLCSWRDPVALNSRMAWLRVARWGSRWDLCNELFGVIRTGALRKTQLLLGIISSDVILLAELAVQGRFVEVPEELFRRRIHARSTVHGGREGEEVITYLVPGAKAELPPRYELIRKTARVLWNREESWFVRVSTTLAFVASYGARQIRRRLRRYAHRLRGTLPPSPPWEVVPAAAEIPADSEVAA